MHAVGHGSTGSPTAKARNLPEQVRSLSVTGLRNALEAVPADRSREPPLDLLTGPEMPTGDDARQRQDHYQDLSSRAFDGSSAMTTAARAYASQACGFSRTRHYVQGRRR